MAKVLQAKLNHLMCPFDETVPKHLGIKVKKTKIDHMIALAEHTTWSNAGIQQYAMQYA